MWNYSVVDSYSKRSYTVQLRVPESHLFLLRRKRPTGEASESYNAFGRRVVVGAHARAKLEYIQIDLSWAALEVVFGTNRYKPSTSVYSVCRRSLQSRHAVRYIGSRSAGETSENFSEGFGFPVYPYSAPQVPPPVETRREHLRSQTKNLVSKNPLTHLTIVPVTL